MTLCRNATESRTAFQYTTYDEGDWTGEQVCSGMMLCQPRRD